METNFEIVLRLGLAVLLGMIIGIERESRDQPAGARTHSLVSLGAALFGVISVYGFLGYQVSSDPSRVAAQVVTGIGFLGAGAILRLGVTIRGLTTAASLWVVAAVGLAAGIGMYVAASAATVLTVVVLVIVRILHEPIRRVFGGGRRLVVVSLERGGDLGEVVRMIAAPPNRLIHIDVEEDSPGSETTITAAVRLGPRTAPEELITAVAGIDGVRTVEMAV